MPEAALAILLVEGDLIIANDERKLPEDEGYAVFLEATGEKAVEFVRNQTGRIDLRKSDGKIALRAEDDGFGRPEEIDPKTAESTGLSLIRMPAEQIDAGWTIKNDGGVKVSLELADEV